MYLPMDRHLPHVQVVGVILVLTYRPSSAPCVGCRGYMSTETRKFLSQGCARSVPDTRPMLRVRTRHGPSHNTCLQNHRLQNQLYHLSTAKVAKSRKCAFFVMG